MTSQSQNFWNFSVALYARERVAESCLNLQNSYGVDINLLLFCYWHGRYHGEIPDPTLQQAIAQSAIWKANVVQPLRNVRQWMKAHDAAFSGTDHSQFNTLRERIKFDELAAERFQQEMLEEIAMGNAIHNKSTFDDEVFAVNINKLFDATGLEMNDLIATKLKTITHAGIALVDKY